MEIQKFVCVKPETLELQEYDFKKVECHLGSELWPYERECRSEDTLRSKMSGDSAICSGGRRGGGARPEARFLFEVN